MTEAMTGSTVSSPEKEKKEKKEETMTYVQMLRQAEVFDYTESRGSIVLRPYGYAMWAKVQIELGARLREEAGAQDAYFPTLIPRGLIQREQEHIEGFKPELFGVTLAGKDTGFVLRPTSEAIIYDSFSRWIKSYRDLPLVINQWCSVFRAEMRTSPFLRTIEFLWQEAHAAHANRQQADNYVRQVLKIYQQFMEDHLALGAVAGTKTESEKFPGAFYTTTLEALPGKKALQVGTSHNLGQGFAEVYNVQLLDKDGQQKHPWLSSHGVSFRVLGGMFLSHRDSRGLILPPKIAPVQVLIIPVYREEKAQILSATEKLSSKLTDSGLRVKIDSRDDKGLGYKKTDAERRGIPVMITVGKKELGDENYSLTRRDLDPKDEQRKVRVPFGNAVPEISEVLDEIQAALLAKSQKHLSENTLVVETAEDLAELLKGKGGLGAVLLCDDPECEAKLKEIKASARCIPFDGQEEKGKCIHCQRPSAYGKRVLVGKAY